jgi:hypothetical protein
MKLSHVFFISIIWIFSSCENSESIKKTKKVESVIIVNKKDIIQFDTLAKPLEQMSIDTFHNALAQLIAGIDYTYFKRYDVIDSLFWDGYSENVARNFNNMKKNRLDPMKKWMKTVSTGKINDTCLLFYPFSGADFLHANYLFPEANNYLLLAQEKVGNVPDIKSMNQIETSKFLNAVNKSLGDIYKRSYFITKRMILDTKAGSELNGLLPLFYWFIARTDHEILDLTNVYVDSLGAINESFINKQLPKGLVNGVKFSFRKKGSLKVKSMTYFSCDISNKGFLKKPEFKQYLDSIPSCNTFVKSASYLLHYGTFNDIRNLTLKKSNAVLEDDTGIPFRYFDKQKWNVNLFGIYVKPVKDFSEKLFQKDLDKAFKLKKKEKLPFSLGYHWGSKSQNQMLYVKTDTNMISHNIDSNKIGATLLSNDNIYETNDAQVPK